MAMKVLICEPIAEEGIARLCAEPELEVDVWEGLQPDELRGVASAYHGVIVRSKTEVTAELLAAAPGLKIVGRAGTGVDNIDLGACTERGVVVVNTPGGNSVSVAELVIGLVIACSRKITRADQLLKQGEWAKKQLKGHELNGKTLGIVGLGRIGRELAMRALPFGLKVLGHDPFVAKGALDDQGVELVDLPELLRRSHIVSLHVPRTDKTAGLIDADALASMREGAILINAARGGIVDERALLAALDSGHVAAAALDAFESEPEPMREIVTHERVIATPHIGASTFEAQEQVGYHVAGYVADYLVRGVLQSAVNYIAVSSEEMRAIGPYLLLAERIGAFVAQVAVGRMRKATITYSGTVASERFELLTDRALCGGLRPFLDETDVNPICARALADARGLEVIEATSRDARGFPALMRVELEAEGGTVTAEGTAFGEGQPPRLIRIDGLPINAPLDGPTVFFRNDDVPGVIGRVGTYVGEQGLNIANFALRGDKQGGAIGVVSVDRRLQRDQRNALKTLPGIRFVRMVDLP